LSLRIWHVLNRSARVDRLALSAIDSIANFGRPAERAEQCGRPGDGVIGHPTDSSID
jgi:hypothetical protein